MPPSDISSTPAFSLKPVSVARASRQQVVINRLHAVAAHIDPVLAVLAALLVGLWTVNTDHKHGSRWSLLRASWHTSLPGWPHRSSSLRPPVRPARMPLQRVPSQVAKAA